MNGIESHANMKESSIDGSMSHASAEARIMELDSLRGLAALGVVLYHFVTRYHELYRHDSGFPLSAKWVTTALPYGRFGVDFFFLISGFVMLMTVTNAKSVRHFFVLRIARLFPAFWIACLATFGVVHALGLPGREVSAQALGLNMTMVPMWLKPWAPWVWYVDGAYWTLKEELLFYLVMGLVLVFGCRRHAIWVVTSLGALHLIGTDSSSWFMTATGFKDTTSLYMSYNLRWFSVFALGMTIFEITRHDGFRWHRHVPVLAIVVADLMPLYQIFPGIFSKRPGPHDWEHFNAVMICATALFLTVRHRPSILRSHYLVFLGSISYALYLVHQNIGYALIRQLQASGFRSILAIPFALVIVLIAASALTFFVEKPVYRWVRSKWNPSR